MAVLLIRYRVRQFGTWQAVFAEYANTRHAYGARSERVYHDPADPCEVVIYLEWDDLERARLFVRSDEFCEEMVEAGVTDRPDVWVLKEADQTAF
jgi:hypothetical protein